MIVLPRASVFCATLLLAACGPAPEGRGKAFLGALLVDGTGGPPLSNSIVIVSGGRILNAGRRSAIAIPGEADKIDGSGKSLLPAPLDACQAAIPRIATLAEARVHVEQGATGLLGMMVDTEDLDPVFLAHLRDLRVVVAPALGASGAQLEIAKRNTKRLFDAGVPIAAAACGGDIFREIEWLVEAGIPPLDAIVAATRNSAALLRRTDVGTIVPGRRADLLLVEGNPGEDIRNLRKVVLRIAAGEATYR